MKQLLIVSASALASGTPKDLTGIGKGKIGFYHLDDDTNFVTAKVTKNFAIALGYENANAFVIPEVDFSSLTVVKATKKAATTFSAVVPVANVVAGAEYGIMVIKKGVVFHERNTWTATSYAKTSNTDAVIADLIKQINASSETSGVKAEAAEGGIKVTAVTAGIDYEVKGVDELTGVEVPTIAGEPATLDDAYMKDLASRCAAGKGFNYTAEDAHEMYPGYPEATTSAADAWTLYTLRFKVGRSAAKQRDEQVYQLVHIAIPENNSELLDTILGVGTTPTPSVEDGD